MADRALLAGYPRCTWWQPSAWCCGTRINAVIGMGLRSGRFQRYPWNSWGDRRVDAVIWVGPRGGHFWGHPWSSCVDKRVCDTVWGDNSSWRFRAAANPNITYHRNAEISSLFSCLYSTGYWHLQLKTRIWVWIPVLIPNEEGVSIGSCPTVDAVICL